MAVWVAVCVCWGRGVRCLGGGGGEFSDPDSSVSFQTRQTRT